MIRSLADLNAAFDAGRFHVQRFQKNTGTVHCSAWADPSYSSGQPGYDARVGVPLQFTPSVAERNDAIWFPSIPSGMTRHLVSWTYWFNQSTYNGPASFVLFDLLGYYPLVDGDSLDLQLMDNPVPLPRYSSGEGVLMVPVNHIAPGLASSVSVIGYTDSDGNEKEVTARLDLNGQNNVCSSVVSTLSGSGGPIGVTLAGGSRGVRQINYIQHTSAPGGLHCLYLLKPLTTLVSGDQNVAVEKEFFTQNGGNCPIILDGAWLGWFHRILTTNFRSTSSFGHFTFAWG